MIRFASMVLILASACGGSKPAPEPVTAGSATHEMKGEDNMPPVLAKFHDTLAPRWHATKGPERMKSTCDALPDFKAGATTIASSEAPKGANQQAWTDGAGKLAAALEELETECKANDAAKFETAFEQVHVSFHGLLDAAGGEHEGAAGEHEDHPM
jgi:hypothetical protein